MIKPHNTNTEFDLGGINHVALVCSDMQKTVDFYSNVLGMPLIKSLDLPGGMGQHFFFDAGNGDCVAFFWFADAPDRVPGISSPEAIPGIGDIVSAVSTMKVIQSRMVKGSVPQAVRRPFSCTRYSWN